jgi:hypothetical protein
LRPACLVGRSATTTFFSSFLFFLSIQSLPSLTVLVGARTSSLRRPAPIVSVTHKEKHPPVSRTRAPSPRAMTAIKQGFFQQATMSWFASRSILAQRKRAGLITRRTLDRNQQMLSFFWIFFSVSGSPPSSSFFALSFLSLSLYDHFSSTFSPKVGIFITILGVLSYFSFLVWLICSTQHLPSSLLLTSCNQVLVTCLVPATILYLPVYMYNSRSKHIVRVGPTLVLTVRE